MPQQVRAAATDDMETQLFDGTLLAVELQQGPVEIVDSLSETEPSTPVESKTVCRSLARDFSGANLGHSEGQVYENDTVSLFPLDLNTGGPTALISKLLFNHAANQHV